VDAVAIVDRLLASVPAASCVGLTEVVLTTAGTPSRGRRRGRLSVHGRRRRTRHVLALYHGSGPAGPAWIEVFVDRILAGVPRVVLRMPPARDLLFAWVVFHELGHHVHQHVGSAPGDPETVADDWAAQFTVMFIHQRYPYLVPLLSVVRWCSRAGKAFARLRARARRKR
jgi:hypothetical protein